MRITKISWDRHDSGISSFFLGILSVLEKAGINKNLMEERASVY